MFDCTVLQQLRKDLQKAKTPKERMKLISDITNHRHECEICSGRYQSAGLQQLHDQAYAGTWGNEK